MSLDESRPVSLEDLYQEIILDHYRSPKNKQPCPECTVFVHQDNPLCGDEIDLHLEQEGGRITKITFQGQGCAISQASASMMTEAVQGLTVEAALKLSEIIRQMMHGQTPSEDIGDLMALARVAKFPVRIKCALLAWVALTEALQGERGR